MKSPTPETQCAECIFQKQYHICAVNFTNKISRSSKPWHNLWKLLTINFRDKYFHNSVDWSGFYLQVYIPSWLAIDLTINPPCRAIPKKFTENNLSPICHEKLSSILYGAGHYAHAPLENLVGMYPSIFARKCRKKPAKILKLAKRIVRQNRSVSLFRIA